MPGFVDTHRHIWEGILRNIAPDALLDDYFRDILGVLAPVYRPQDAYAGNLVSAYGAIDAGITTLLDWSHIQNTPEHTDASIAALQESGLRAVFAYGTPNLDLAAWWYDSTLKHPHGHPPHRDAVLLVDGSAADAGAGAARSRVHDAGSVEARLGSGARARHADQRARRRGRGRHERAARRDGQGRPARPRHHLHPLLHAQRRGAADDCRHRRHGVAGLADRAADGPRHAADSALPRPRPAAQPQRGRRDHDVRRPVRADALGADAAARRRSTSGGCAARPTCRRC